MTDVALEIKILRMHIDQIDVWAREAREMLYNLEDKLIDSQEEEWFEKYGGVKW